MRIRCTIGRDQGGSETIASEGVISNAQRDSGGTGRMLLDLFVDAGFLALMVWYADPLHDTPSLPGRSDLFISVTFLYGMVNLFRHRRKMMAVLYLAIGTFFVLRAVL